MITCHDNRFIAWLFSCDEIEGGLHNMPPSIRELFTKRFNEAWELTRDVEETYQMMVAFLKRINYKWEKDK